MQRIPKSLVVVNGCLMNREIAALAGAHQNGDCKERGWFIRRSAKELFEMRRREAMRRHNLTNNNLQSV